MTKSGKNQTPKAASLYTPEEEEVLRGRFADTWTGRLSILVVVMFLGFLGVWVFTSMIAQAKTPAPWQNLVHLQKFIKGFHLAGVTMGMTPDMVRTLHPKLLFTAEPETGTVSSHAPIHVPIHRGSFVANHTPYTVWFANLTSNTAAPGQAYRIRFHRHYNSSNENEALNDFGRKLGRPLSTTCMRSQLAASAKTCVFKWLRNGIDVIMVSKLIYFVNADPRTYISITATDTLTAAKLHKHKRLQQLTRILTP